MNCTKPHSPRAQLGQAGGWRLLGEGCACSSPYPCPCQPWARPHRAWKSTKTPWGSLRGAHRTVGAQIPPPLIYVPQPILVSRAVTQKQGWFVFRLCPSCRTRSSPHVNPCKKLIIQSVFFNSVAFQWQKRSFLHYFFLTSEAKNGTGRDFMSCCFFLAHTVWEVCTELKHSCCG